MTQPSFIQASQPLLRTWGGKGDDSGSGVTIDSTGNTYVTGGTGSFGGFTRVFLLKYSSAGSLVWQKVWGGGSEDPTGLVVDPSGSIYIAGFTSSFNPGGNDQAFLLKINVTGALVWQKTFGTFTHANAIALSPSGDVYLTGYTSVSNGLMLLKISPEGNVLRQKVWGGNFTQAGEGIAVNAAGDVYVTGGTDSFDVNYPNGTSQRVNCGTLPCSDSVLLKFNSTSSLAWQRIWRTKTTDQSAGDRISLDSLGNVIVGGFSCTQRGVASCNSTISKFSSNGSLLWQKSWQGIGFVHGIAVDASGDIYTTGDNGGSAFLMEVNPTGKLLSLTTITGGIPAAGGANSDAITLTASGTPIFTGGLFGPPSSFHARTLNLTLNSILPSIAIPAGAFNDLNLQVLNLTGVMSDVNGSTSYAGNVDVYLSYGVAFGVPALNPLEILPLLAIIALFVRCSSSSKRRNRGDRRT